MSSKVSKGKLKAEDEKKIIDNYVFLCQSLDTKNILGTCRQLGLIDGSEQEKTKNTEPKVRKAEQFLHFLLESGNDGFSTFIKVLEKYGSHQFVLDKLTLPEEGQPPIEESAEGGQIESLSNQIEEVAISDPQCNPPSTQLMTYGPVSEGKLKPEDERKITSNLKFITENLEPNHILPDCIQNRLIAYPQLDEIRNILSKEVRVDTFLKYLLNSGTDGLPKFMASLESYGRYPTIVTKLNEPVRCPSPAPDPCAWIDNLSEEMKQRKPSDSEMSRFSDCFGARWEKIFLDLGFSVVAIQNMLVCKMNDPVMCRLALLVKWRNKSARRGTMYNFLQILRNFVDRDDVIVDWEKVKTIAETPPRCR